LVVLKKGDKKMETLSFILGVSSVVVIAIAVVAVVGFFKVKSVEREINEYRRSFTVEFDNTTKDIHDTLNHTNDSLHRRIDNTEREICSQLDSRLDKLETKLTRK
jgi:uncharacterized protein YoxC